MTDASTDSRVCTDLLGVSPTCVGSDTRVQLRAVVLEQANPHACTQLDLQTDNMFWLQSYLWHQRTLFTSGVVAFPSLSFPAQERVGKFGVDTVDFADSTGALEQY